MTLCIAAKCEHKGDERIVLCNEFREETQAAGSDTTDKFRDLPNGWVALLAGTIFSASALIAEFESELYSLEEVRDDAALLTRMEAPVKRRRAALADNLAYRRLAVPYAKFLAEPAAFPDSIREDFLRELAEVRLGAQLLVAGFYQPDNDPEPGKRPYIFLVDEDANGPEAVSFVHNFAAIGSGASVAHAALYQRQLDDSTELMRTVYALWEAHELAYRAGAPGVGEMKIVDVLDDSGRPARTLSTRGDARCRTLFERLGPKLDPASWHAGKEGKWKEDYLNPASSASGAANVCSQGPTAPTLPASQLRTGGKAQRS
ncbi:MAG: hypothetical protein ACRD2E_02970 [Terriglobales bacterium]